MSKRSGVQTKATQSVPRAAEPWRGGLEPQAENIPPGPPTHVVDTGEPARLKEGCSAAQEDEGETDKWTEQAAPTTLTRISVCTVHLTSLKFFPGLKLLL